MEILAINISVAEIVDTLIMTLGVVIVIIVILSYGYLRHYPQSENAYCCQRSRL